MAQQLKFIGCKFKYQLFLKKNPMKSLKLFFLLSVLFTLTSCLDMDVAVENDALQIENEIGVLSGMADNVFNSVDAFVNGININQPSGMAKALAVVAMPEITYEPEKPNVYPRRIIVDFGEGMYAPNGLDYYAGVVIIDENAPSWKAGSERLYSFKEFSVNKNKLEGKKTIINLNEGETKRLGIYWDYVWTQANEKVVKVQSERIRELISDNGTKDDYFDDTYEFTGYTKGSSSKDTQFSIKIERPLKLVRPWRYFVSGTYVITTNSNETHFDFGDGEKDNIIFITNAGKTHKEELKY